LSAGYLATFPSDDSRNKLYITYTEAATRCGTKNFVFRIQYTKSSAGSLASLLLVLFGVSLLHKMRGVWTGLHMGNFSRGGI
jgi:hypothetical protein